MDSKQKNDWDFDDMINNIPISTQSKEQNTNISQPKKNSKEYPYANGRTPKKITITIYENEEVRRKGLEKGFTGGAVSHYINYLIDKDLGIIKE